MALCAVVGCKNRFRKGFMKLYRFPRDPERRLEWGNKLQRKDWYPSDNSRICQVHFENDQFEAYRLDGRKNLKPNAVPTIFRHLPPPQHRKTPAKRSSVLLCNNTEGQRHVDHGYAKAPEVDPFLTCDLPNVETRATAAVQDKPSTPQSSLTVHGSSSPSYFSLNVPFCEDIVVSTSDGGAFQQQAIALQAQVKDLERQPKQQKKAVLRKNPQHECAEAESRSAATPGLLTVSPGTAAHLTVRVPVGLLDDCPLPGVCARRGAMMEAMRLDSSVNSCDEQQQWQTTLSATSHRGDHCRKVSTSKASVPRHTHPHAGKERLGCVQAGQMFTAEGDNTEHTLTDAGVRNLVCEQCGKNFSSKGSLTRHILTHTGTRNFLCQKCGKRFTQLGGLSRHLLSHAGTRNFQCQECGKRFYSKGDLKQHILTHTNTRNFKCQACGKKFHYKSNLNKHILIHTGTRDFECQECGKKFTQSSHLSSHNLTHTGARNFECKECGKMFVWSSSLNSHMLTHSGDRKFKCDVCGKCYLTKSGVARHVQTHL